MFQSRLCARHFQGNGYGFDGPWRHESQRHTATREALERCYAWIDGQESREDYRDAVTALLELQGDPVRPGCRSLWVASLDHWAEDDAARLAYFDQGMDQITRYLRRTRP